MRPPGVFLKSSSGASAATAGTRREYAAPHFHAQDFISRLDGHRWENVFLPLGSRMLWRDLRMGRLQAVIPHRARGRQSDMHKRGPALQFVMSVAVKEIGSPDGSAGAGCFNGAKSRVIVHDVIGKKNFLPAPPPHIQSRKIIQRACRSNARD